MVTKPKRLSETRITGPYAMPIPSMSFMDQKNAQPGSRAQKLTAAHPLQG
jgi:hypothetical protein